MLEVYRIDEEGSHLVDLHLNCTLEGRPAFITNGTADGIDEDLVNTLREYGFEVMTEFMPLPELNKWILSMVSRGYDEIVIDNLAEWVLGHNPDGETLEDIYTEASLDGIRDFILKLLAFSGTLDTKVCIIVNDYFYVYLQENFPNHVFDFISE